LCLFMGCVGKSAQFPLLTWLPNAMEGPTPVSALLHAATMVAAGIFLLARIHPLLSPDALLVIAVVGTITAVWGGYSALFQTDIKKVLAFSTVSQLGLMVAAMGTGQVSAALFHLLTHAFFKAGLFLSAGAVIHAVHTQNMLEMGSLRTKLPVTFWAYTTCAGALAGLPFFSGFLSKEVILGGAFAWAAREATMPGGGLIYLIPVLLLLSSGLTALYMARQWRLVFFGQSHYNASVHPHEADPLMTGPMIALAVLSVGFWFSWNPLPAHEGWFFRLFPVVETETAGWLAPASVVLAGVAGWVGFRMNEPDQSSFRARLSVQYGFLDELYEIAFIKPIRQLSARLYRFDQRRVDGVVDGLGTSTVVVAHIAGWVDRYLVDGIVTGLVWVANRLGRLTRSAQNGRVQSYIATAVMVLLVLLWWLL
ncbi:MAG: NADH-quinone oxidoreductase subunit M, partial [Bacteroidetes bacterium]|nr:NADH-quinone oxidoreductase subunit M [Fibrella sp.]